MECNYIRSGKKHDICGLTGGLAACVGNKELCTEGLQNEDKQSLVGKLREMEKSAALRMGKSSDGTRAYSRAKEEYLSTRKVIECILKLKSHDFMTTIKGIVASYGLTEIESQSCADRIQGEIYNIV